MALDLIKMKERKETVLNLKKEKGLDNQKASVVLALDFSGSMSSLYRNGVVQETVERILPLGLGFDDNNSVDFFLFHDDFIKVPENITLKNVDGYIDKKVIGTYSMGGTNYAPVLNAILEEHFGKRSSGLLSGLFSSSRKSELENKQLEYPVYVIFITDGENGDHRETEEVVREAAKRGVFIQFVGIGNERFTFLNKLDNLTGRELDNANFLQITNLKTVDDTQLYKWLMAEFPGWVSQARTKGFIK